MNIFAGRRYNSGKLMSNLLNVVDELEDLLFDGRQKNERRAAADLYNMLFLFGLCLDRSYVAQRLPYVIRNSTVSLKEEHGKKMFPILARRQESTELDILFINAPSFLGHRAKLNYHVEVETQQRDDTAFQRLLDFSAFCMSKGIDLAPILVTTRGESRYVQDICNINIDDLRKSGAFYERYADDIEHIPGLACDDAACCFYILDLVSSRERFIREELLVELRTRGVLRQRLLDFKKLATEDVLSLGDCLGLETPNNFNHRMVGYINKLKEKGLLEDTPDGKAHRLGPSGGKLILDWRSGV